MPAFRSCVRMLPDYDPREVSDAGVRVRAHRNESPLPPPRHVVDAVRAIDARQLSRYPVDLLRACVQAIADRTGVPARCVMLGNGADEILLGLARAMLERGDNAVMLRPSFGMYARAAAISGADVRELAYAERWKLDADALIELTDDRTRLIFLGHPNNPTGESLDPGALAYVARAVPQAAIAVDETYLAFAAESLARFAGSPPNVVVVGSLSKTCALAGMRVGYGIAQSLVTRMLRRVSAPYPVGVASLIAAEAYVNGGAATERFEADWRKQVKRSLDAIVEVCSPFARAVWRGCGNFALVQFAVDVPELSLDLLRRGIAVRTYAQMRDCLRFSALDDAETNELVDALRTSLRRQRPGGFS